MSTNSSHYEIRSLKNTGEPHLLVRFAEFAELLNEVTLSEARGRSDG